MIVQEMVRGFEMRATVVEGRLDNVLVRIPAYVTGDGTSTIDELIRTKCVRTAASSTTSRSSAIGHEPPEHAGDHHGFHSGGRRA